MDKLWHDIEKYRSGALSASEMHALEKRALTDPFLAEALEGAGDLDPAAFSADVADLQKRIQARTDSSAKVIPLWRWVGRIAAGLALLAASTFILLNFLAGDDKGNDHLALHKERSMPPLPERDSIILDVEEAEKIASDKAVEKPEAAPLSSPPPSADPSTSRARPPRITQAPSIADDRNKDVMSDPVTQADPVVSSSARIEEEMQAEPEIPFDVKDTEPAAVMESRSALKAESARPASRVVRGQVVDAEEGKGLPGVNVTIRGTSTGTVTDAEGNYEIPLDDLNEGLVFSFIGFESTEVVPGSKNEVNVALHQDVSQLSEVVVVGYGEKKTDSFSETYPTLELAEPEGGKKAFKQYLEHNLRYPEQALNNKVEGKVTVQFTIESSGQLSDFKVLKGLGYGCDEEVIRLIKSGPRWSATKRNAEPVRDKVKVRLKFALPKK